MAFRDKLVIDWNKTQQKQTFADKKRVYCTNGPTDLSLEFLMGRALDNAMLNVQSKDIAR
ncbi:Non-essential glycogen phosphorylase, partial [Ascosphaera atra]